MRSIARVLVVGILFASSSRALAADSGSSWWPFGQHDDKAEATTAPGTSPLQTPHPAGTSAPLGTTPSAPLAHQTQSPVTPVEPEAKEHWMFNSPNGKVGWPHLTKPHLPQTGALAQKKPADAARNSWVEKTPTPAKPSPLKPITDGAHKVATGTKNAWHKTVNAITPGDPAPTPRSGTSSRIAKQEVKPPFWKRMFGTEPEPKGSQTMPGFLAQQRVDSQESQKR